MNIQLIRKTVDATLHPSSNICLKTPISKHTPFSNFKAHSSDICFNLLSKVNQISTKRRISIPFQSTLHFHLHSSNNTSKKCERRWRIWFTVTDVIGFRFWGQVPIMDDKEHQRNVSNRRKAFHLSWIQKEIE